MHNATHTFVHREKKVTEGVATHQRFSKGNKTLKMPL